MRLPRTTLHGIHRFFFPPLMHFNYFILFIIVARARQTTASSAYTSAPSNYDQEPSQQKAGNGSESTHSRVFGSYGGASGTTTVSPFFLIFLIFFCCMFLLVLPPPKN